MTTLNKVLKDAFAKVFTPSTPGKNVYSADLVDAVFPVGSGNNGDIYNSAKVVHTSMRAIHLVWLIDQVEAIEPFCIFNMTEGRWRSKLVSAINRTVDTYRFIDVLK